MTSGILVDHSIFRAFDRGALGILNVRGEQTQPIFTDGAER